MTVAFVGAQANAGTTVTIPAHQSGDLILILAFRDGSVQLPSTPAASGTVPSWVLINNSGASTCSGNFRYFVATGSTTTSGTWTNATEMVCLVYRGVKVIGANAVLGGNSNIIAYPALTLQRTDNSSWVVGVAGHRSATNVEVAPTGMTNRASTGTEAAGHDTNGTVSSWSQQTVTVSASSGWRSWTVELRDATVVVTGEAQAFTAAGQDATLSKFVPPRVITGEVGGFTLSGQAAGTLLGRRLISAGGTFSATGQDAALKQIHRLVSDAASYAVDGQAAALRQSHIIAAAVGSFTVNGQAAGTLLSRQLAADAGAVTASGQDALLEWGRLLTADAASYALVAPDIAFLHTHTLIGEVGAVTLSGQSVMLDYLRRLDPDAGAFATSGNSAGASYRRRQVLVF